ncbi:MAG: glycosyltransferase family 4 protein [Bacteroidia bacterium]|nr:glycosyltransferase family 4 protein [Bacteroidia bacterium]
MKVLLLSDTYSEHTEKWALGLANSGIKVGLFSFNKASYSWYVHDNITVFFEPDNKINADTTLTKIAYIKYVAILKKIIRHFEPDILHAHYATSYGFVGALTGFHPFVISSWGSDVMKFPNKNFVAKSILKFNFKKANLLCATSFTIEEYIHQVIDKPVSVIPFGINIDEFKPKKVKSLFNDNDIVLGSIKPLEGLYNIDILIKSYAKLSLKFDNLKLLIIGEGTEDKNLKELCKELGIFEKVTFTGRVAFKEISNYYNMLDVLVNISEYESFGVSVVEAMACEVPVIVSNVGGLKEVVKDESVGLKVNIGDVDDTARAIERLITDKELYERVAVNGRKHVIEKYNWKNNLQQMINEYSKLLIQQKK